MSESFESSAFAETLAKRDALLNVSVGMASPLWGLFAGAAVGGSAWWWMTRWTRAENLEALFGAAEAAPLDPTVAPAAIAEAAAAVQAIVEPPALDAPVGGESAPIAPALAAAEPPAAEPDIEPEAEAAAGKPKARRAEPKPE